MMGYARQPALSDTVDAEHFVIYSLLNRVLKMTPLLDNTTLGASPHIGRLRITRRSGSSLTMVGGRSKRLAPRALPPVLASFRNWLIRRTPLSFNFPPSGSPPSLPPAPPPPSSRTTSPPGNASFPFALFVVPMLWGTFAPSMQGIYSLPEPPTAAELCAIRACIGAAVLAPVLLRPPWDATGRVRYAALELGLYEILAQGLQAYGLNRTTASRAGFVLSMINVMVPAMAALGGQPVALPVWGACALSMIGIDTLRGKGDGSGASSGGLSEGDTIMLGAATAMSWHNVRLGSLAPGLDTARLAAGKCAVMAFGSTAWYALEGGSKWASSLWHGGPEAFQAWGLVLYNAIFPGCLATRLQMGCAESVSATKANLVFATTPVFNAGFAAAVLRESLSEQTLRGGAILVAASLVPIIFSA
eukprot:gnl/TRDRNA2_/TRDRNA2_167870_c2_seq1.p1 gnl/TRDRNA2_/TRDRNA2_167870_c2~~gnl/TRDRNA2_/TRDRNA2_167870_c2_seq1.p1  ORF type:complete len:483 (+),score=39.07 gnl/TRDRNA2_/TRDRNA2_167870_c2_seq1:201-1451(+)